MVWNSNLFELVRPVVISLDDSFCILFFDKLQIYHIFDNHKEFGCCQFQNYKDNFLRGEFVLLLCYLHGKIGVIISLIIKLGLSRSLIIGLLQHAHWV